jgi:two-component system response regulator HydG
MQKVYRLAKQVAPSKATVLITGESGTGKGEFARAIHALSPRKDKPFVAAHCASLAETLLESELFGHERGSFTGAEKRRPGRFEQADKGTIFLDEVGEIPPATQIKLLTVLQERRFERVGGNESVNVDVRIIAATNRDLWTEVKRGSFREDLYFRLQVLPLVLPPLRERREDIPALAYHLLERIGSRVRISEQAEALMVGYEWQGNVRELLNVLRRAVLFVDGEVIDAALMRRMLAASGFSQAAPPSAGSAETTDGAASSTNLADVERAHIARVLAQMEGNVTRAATALGIDRRTLQRKLKSFGLASED